VHVFVCPPLIVVLDGTPPLKLTVHSSIGTPGTVAVLPLNDPRWRKPLGQLTSIEVKRLESPITTEIGWGPAFGRGADGRGPGDGLGAGLEDTVMVGGGAVPVSRT
jgi:hypothetical protein